MPTVGSLFSGIGGLDLGLERAGWSVRWQVEIDPFCRRVLAKHWPNVARHGDVRSFPLANTERVDLICGGFPCQPVSQAGKRLAQADTRWLWPELHRVVRILRPGLLLVENVPGLLGRGLGDVLGDLAELGYDAEWDCLPAAAFGAPHLRNRVWIVAHAHGRRWEGRWIAQPPGIESPRGRVAHRRRQVQQFDDASARAHPDLPGLEGTSDEVGREGADLRERQPADANWWAAEPDVGRVAHGISARVDRLRGLGNAVVPQVAEWIGRRLRAAL